MTHRPEVSMPPSLATSSGFAPCSFALRQSWQPPWVRNTPLGPCHILPLNIRLFIFVAASLLTHTESPDPGWLREAIERNERVLEVSF
jgi:hypothetical protein